MLSEQFLKLNDMPHMIKGRWYHAFIESDGNAYTMQCDLEDAQISSTYFIAPWGFHITDVKYDVNTDGGTATSAANTSFVLRRMGDGSQGVTIPAKDAFDYMHLYVFGYFGA